MPAGMGGREGNMKKKLLGLVACVATLALSGALLAGCSGLLAIRPAATPLTARKP